MMASSRARLHPIASAGMICALVLGLLAVSEAQADAHRLFQRTETAVYGNARGCVSSSVEHGGSAVIGGYVGANPINANCDSGIRANNVIDSRVTLQVQRLRSGSWGDCLTQSSGWRGSAPARATGRTYGWLTVRDLCTWRSNQVRARTTGSIMYNDGTLRSRVSITSGHGTV